MRTLGPPVPVDTHSSHTTNGATDVTEEDRIPSVSVIIPTYNSDGYITQAITSVLSQTYSDYEIIVIDDGSTDDTRTALISYMDKITYLYQDNRGVSAARNLGIRHARAELIAFLDADDVWLPQKLEEQLRFVTQNSHVALVFGDAELFDVAGTVMPAYLRQKAIASCLSTDTTILKDAFNLLLEENFIVTSTALVRRWCLQKVGGFDESLRSVEDRDLWLRIARRFPIGCVLPPLTRKRVHDSNISDDTLLALQSRIKVIERATMVEDSPRACRPYGLQSRLARLYFLLGYDYFDKEEYKKARENFLVSLSKELRAKAVIYYLASILGKRAVIVMRYLKQWVGWVSCG